LKQSGSSNIYRIGQNVKTKIKEVDLEKMRIDLALEV
jgi:ribosomal protein S1